MRFDMGDTKKWLSVKAAAAHFDRHPGHLRKICPRLQQQGFARMVSGRHHRPSWEIRQDATLEAPMVEKLMDEQDQTMSVIRRRLQGLTPHELAIVAAFAAFLHSKPWQDVKRV
jgi:hypothetical protein